MTTILEDKYLENEDATFLLQEDGDYILLNYFITARHIGPEIVLIRGKG